MGGKQLWNMKVTVIPIVVGALRTITEGSVKRLEELKIRGQVEIIPDYNIIKIGPNTEKSPGDLRRLAITPNPLRNNQLTLA